MKPILSIIIANYNYGRFLEEAIQSVVAQNMGDKIELIICDAASTDNSVEIIKKYANGLPPNISYTDWINSSNRNSQTPPLITWWCSEKDGGQSAAFNKGFSHAKGRFLTWLNADDVLLPGTLKKLELAAKQYPGCEWFVGGVIWLDKAMKVIKCGRGRRFSEIRYKEGWVNVWGPSSFFTKRMLDAVGGVDERYHYSMDTELWLKFASKLGARYRPFVNYAWGLRLHEDAKMSGHNFTSNDGNGDESEMDKLRRSPHFAQMKQEELWMWEWFDRRPHTKITRFLSAAYLQVALAWLDTKRCKGKHNLEICK